MIDKSNNRKLSHVVSHAIFLFWFIFIFLTISHTHTRTCNFFLLLRAGEHIWKKHRTWIVLYRNWNARRCIREQTYFCASRRDLFQRQTNWNLRSHLSIEYRKKIEEKKIIKTRSISGQTRLILSVYMLEQSVRDSSLRYVFWTSSMIYFALMCYINTFFFAVHCPSSITQSDIPREKELRKWANSPEWGKCSNDRAETIVKYVNIIHITIFKDLLKYIFNYYSF